MNCKQRIQKTVQKYSYYLNDILGEGYSSQVYRGVNIYTNQVVAIKVINFQTLTTPISQTLLRNEINVLQQLNHPNLMRVFEIFESKNNKYLVCEYCNEGDLANILERTNFSNIELLDIFVQIAKGIKALHDKKIIHRDIKPANILKSDGVYKLADFGFAIAQDDFESIIKRFNVGTPVYMAPETVELNQYSEKSDIWSLGVVLYLMVYKELPFNQNKNDPLIKNQQVLHSRVRNDPKLISKLKELIIGMLEIDPNKRFSIDHILSLLNKQKKLSCVTHDSMPCKTMRRISVNDLLDNKKVKFQEYGNLQLPCKTLPDEILNDGKDEQLDFDNQAMGKKQINCNFQISSKKLLNTLQSVQNKKQVLINVPNVETKYILKLNFKQNKVLEDHNCSQQHSNPNSTKDTIITNNQSSNCHSQQQASLNSPMLLNKINDVNLISSPNKEPKIINQSLQNLIVSSPLTTRKESQPHQSATPNKFIQYSQNQRQNDYCKQRAKTDLSLTNINDQQEMSNQKMKKYEINTSQDFDRIKSNEKNKEKLQEEKLSATIKPTYKFLVYLNEVIKKLDSINTEEKQKCYFLLRKLLAVKADAISKFCPRNEYETLQAWIDSFQQYYQKVVPLFDPLSDKKFNQYFNNNLGQFTKGFTQFLYDSLDIVNSKAMSKDLLTIQEVIYENIKQFNDPILFARRWENDQLAL